MNELAKSKMNSVEFIALMALMTSFVALGIDAMLPALPSIATDLKVSNINDVQLVVTALLLGLGFGQLFYGPFSDAVGRRTPIFLGVSLFAVGCVTSLMAPNFSIMILGRFIQGLGVAGPKVVTTALVRDKFEGRAMAKIMSLIMSVFILVPALAPLLGQLILSFSGWRMIFWLLIILSVFCLAWFTIRQPETLEVSNRVRFSPKNFISAITTTFSNRIALGYMIASSLLFGAFVGYLSTSQQIFESVFHVGDKFPLYFGSLALAIGGASLFNAKHVYKFGMQKLSWFAVIGFSLSSNIFLVYALSLNAAPPLDLFLGYMFVAFFFIGILFGNFNSLAIQPLGHIAGSASAIIGTTQSCVSVLIGIYIGKQFNQTITPMIISFAILSLLTALTMFCTESPFKKIGVLPKG